jgi:hypothetical protein
MAHTDILVLKLQTFYVYKLESDAEEQILQLVAKPQLTRSFCVVL